MTASEHLCLSASECPSDRGPIRAALRRVGLGGLAASAASAIVAIAAPAAASADTVLMVGGADVQAFPGAQNGAYMPAILGGSLCKSDSGNLCLVVPFSGSAGVLTPTNPQPLDASVGAAADALAQQIKQTPGRKIAVGYSAGAPVVEEAAQRLSSDPNGPPPDELSLITVGNINDGLAQMVPPGTYLQSIGYTVRPPSQTQYAKTVITDRNDFPTAVPNPLAHPLEALNSVSDAAHAHLGYFSPDIDLANPSYLVRQDGNVSHLVLPGQHDSPPAPQAVSDIGQPALANAVVAPVPDANPPVAPSPGGDPAYPVPPALVDQFIGAAAPMFASTVNDDKDKLVEQLLPVLVEHPEMFNGVPLIAPQQTAAAPASDVQALPGATAVAPGS